MIRTVMSARWRGGRAGGPAGSLVALLIGAALLLGAIFLLVAPRLDQRDDARLLVIGATGAAGSLDEEGGIVVTGVVRPYDRADLERDLGPVAESGELADWEGHLVLIAEPLAQTTGGGDEPASAVPLVGVTTLVGDPDRYVGRPIAVTGEVEEVVIPGVFLLDDE